MGSEAGTGTETETEPTPPSRFAAGRFEWIDGSLFALSAASLLVVVVGGLVQVSFGAFSMTFVEAWGAVFDLEVLSNLQTWEAFLLGSEVPEMGKRSLVVWNVRLPRVFVAVLVGMNLAVSGAIF